MQIERHIVSHVDAPFCSHFHPVNLLVLTERFTWINVYLLQSLGPVYIHFPGRTNAAA